MAAPCDFCCEGWVASATRILAATMLLRFRPESNDVGREKLVNGRARDAENLAKFGDAICPDRHWLDTGLLACLAGFANSHMKALRHRADAKLERREA